MPQALYCLQIRRYVALSCTAAAMMAMVGTADAICGKQSCLGPPEHVRPPRDEPPETPPQAAPKFTPGSEPAWETADDYGRSAAAHLAAGEYDAALADINKAFKYTKEGSSTHYEILGAWYRVWSLKDEHEGNYVGAINDAKKAITEEPAFIYWLRGGSNVYQAWKDRIQYLKKQCFAAAKKRYQDARLGEGHASCPSIMGDCLNSHGITAEYKILQCVVACANGAVSCLTGCGLVVYQADVDTQACYYDNVNNCQRAIAKEYASDVDDCKDAAE